MSDHEHHGGHDGHDHHAGGGAHEVDKMPSSRLFNLLFGLSGLTLLASIGVVQLFYRQVDSIRDTRDSKMSFQLAEYRKEMDELANGWSVVEMTDDDEVPADKGGKGVHEARRYQMPLAEARKRVLEQPQQYLKASRPYRGWTSRDANAPKPVPGQGAVPRNPMRVPSKGGVVPPAGAQPLPGVVPPVQPVPVPPAEAVDGKVPADGVPVDKGEGKAPAKGEGKAEAKASVEGGGKAEAKAGDKAEAKASANKGGGKAEAKAGDNE
jgi:hypothetical protein